MDKSDFGLIALLLVAVVSIGGVSYLIGKKTERDFLVEEFKRQVEVAYFEGLEDGVKKGFREGQESNCSDEGGRY